jgi:hypothetical protein
MTRQTRYDLKADLNGGMFSAYFTSTGPSLTPVHKEPDLCVMEPVLLEPR